VTDLRVVFGMIFGVSEWTNSPQDCSEELTLCENVLIQEDNYVLVIYQYLVRGLLEDS